MRQAPLLASAAMADSCDYDYNNDGWHRVRAGGQESASGEEKTKKTKPMLSVVLDFHGHAVLKDAAQIDASPMTSSGTLLALLSFPFLVLLSSSLLSSPLLSSSLLSSPLLSSHLLSLLSPHLLSSLLHYSSLSSL